ncbi:MAG: DUF484 domain-containing protein [Gammaproteobacteria bacterium]|nr:MAG: DUF484 domain-containing protein [Gammaproteobacteria bacterium]RTZ74430.1 MAG: DUF484 domain-containing protein [Gammaproteobacteria bacterium]
MNDSIDQDHEREIAEYLLSHPDFFVRNEEVLNDLEVPHRTGDAVSLIEHKVRMLQDKANQYQKQLQELIAVARENEQLNQRLHRLTLNLIESTSVEEVLATLQDELRDRFNADAVELKLFSTEDLKEAQVSEAGMAIFRKFMHTDKPTCGPLKGEKLKVLFGDQAGEEGSAALIPIRTSDLSGVLAIGSRDRERFHSGKGVDFLVRLGELVSLTLQAVSARHPR